MRFVRILFHSLLFLFLTALTQIGGVIYLLVYFVFRKSLLKRWFTFVGLYLGVTFLVVPYLAPLFGRERITTNRHIKVHSIFTTVCNRNYVVPQLNIVLADSWNTISKQHPDLEIRCLDANFPFWNGFPMAPHLSHKDGKKLDISLLYTDVNGSPTNAKPSRTGYGVFEGPLTSEYNQIMVCKDKGYWQYDFPKYLTFGVPHPDLKFNEVGTRNILKAILKQRTVSKVFIEPHLRKRLKLEHAKLRYHGCRAVRHDDHIHLQVK
jgi:hypothetical protein